MSENFELGQQPIVAFVPTRNPEQARAFYRDTLGLTLTSDELPFALVFDAHGTMLRVTAVGEFTPARYTILGWAVKDIESAVRALRARGVEFMRVPNLQQDELGVWAAPGGAKVAWFHDPDGNTLSLSEH